MILERLEPRLLLSADLGITSVVAPATATILDAIEVSWTVENQGADTTSSMWTDRVYISDDAIRDDGDTSLIYRDILDEQPLAPGASYTITEQVTIPNTAPGDRYLLFITDRYENEPESDETNNIIVVPIGLSAPDVDLRIDSIRGPPGNEANLGHMIEVGWTVTNYGSIDAIGTWRDELYLSDDDVLDAEDDYLTYEFISEGESPKELAPGQSYEATVFFNLSNVSGGSRYLIAVADAQNELTETNEANNTIVAPLLIHGPDLVALDFAAPAVVDNSLSFDISWTVANQGDAGAVNGWQDSIFLSQDNIYDPGDILLAGEWKDASTPLAPAQSYTVTKSITIDEVGDYYLLFQANSWNDIPELDNSNNLQAAAITIRGPNLIVISATAPNSAMLEEEIAVSWTVRNDGPAAALSGWQDRIYLSDDTVYDVSEDDNITGYIYSNPLDPGSEYTRSTSISIDYYYSAGSRYLLFITDRYEDQKETNEDNNVFSLPIDLDGPDLVISNAVAPASANVDEDIDISWTVTNDSSIDAAATYWYDLIYFSADDQLDDTDVEATSYSPDIYLPLAAGASYTMVETLTIDDDAIGSNYIIFVADGYYYQGETEEGNNIMALPFEVFAPDLVITDATAPAQAPLSSSITVSWTVENQGNAPAARSSWYDRLYLSDDDVYDSGDVYVAYLTRTNTTPLDVGASYSLAKTWTLQSSSRMGSQYLIIVADESGRQDELDEDNNTYAVAIELLAPDLIITAATAPATIIVGWPVSVSWTVQNQGEASASASYWYDRVYLSANENKDWMDSQLYSISTSSYTPLAADGSYTVIASITVNIPSTFVGVPQYLVFVTDDTAIQGELDETNNSYAVPIVVTGPDLVVVSATGPASAAINETVEVSWTVQNQGNEPISGTLYDGIYLSRRTYSWSPWTDYDIHQEVISPPDALEPDESYTITLNVTLPNQNLYIYEWALRFKADSSNARSELNEDNNFFTLPIELAMPDLVISDISAPSQVFLGQEIDISWTVTNAGSVGAFASWSDYVYISDNDTIGSGDTLVISQSASSYSPLAPDESYTFNITVTVPNTGIGNRFIVFKADRYANQQYETDEYNNELALPILLGATDLVISNVNAPATALLGETIELSWTVNQRRRSRNINGLV